MEDTLNNLITQLAEMKNKIEALQAAQLTPREASISAPRQAVNPPTVLTVDTSFDVWKRMIVGELTSLGYSDVLESPENEDGSIRYDVESNEVKSRLNYVSTFILARVDDTYKQSLCDLQMPFKMLKKLHEIRFPNLLSMRMSLKRQWSNVQMASNEKVLEFTNKYNEMTKRLIGLGMKIDDVEIVGNYVIAMKLKYPELSRRFDTQNNITFDEMKNLALNLESSEEELKARSSETTTSVNVTETRRTTTKLMSSEAKEIICFRCGKPNHVASECKNPRKICYNCGKLGSHEQKDCTAPKTNIEMRAKFPSVKGRGGVLQRRGSSRGMRGRSFRGRGRGNSFRGRTSSGEVLYRKMKIRTDGKEKVLLVDTNNESSGYEVEVGEANLVESKLKECFIFDANTINSNNGDLNKHIIKCIGDSGATEHVFQNNSGMVNICKVKDCFIKSANKNLSSDLKVESKGDVFVKLNNNKVLKLADVLQTKEIAKNIISIRKLVNENIQVILDKESIQLINKVNGEVLMTGKYDGRFWWLEIEANKQGRTDNLCLHNTLAVHKPTGAGWSVSQGTSTVDTGGMDWPIPQNNIINSQNHNTIPSARASHLRSEKLVLKSNNTNDVSIPVSDIDLIKNKYDEVIEKINTILNDKKNISSKNKLAKDKGMQWHIRLGHVSRTYLMKAAEYIPELKDVHFDADIQNCEICFKAKAKRKPCTSERFRQMEPLSLMHTDLMGPIAPSTYKYGHKYIVSFIDDATRYVWAYTLPDKGSVHSSINVLLEDICIVKGQEARIREFRLDNGTEYKTEQIKDLLKKEKIYLNPVPTYTPNLNGVAERLNLDLQQRIRSLLFDSGFPQEMWAYALQFAVDLYNRTPKKALNGKTPFISFLGKPVNLKFMRRFGCEAYALRTAKLTKFAERILTGYLVRCNEDSYNIIARTCYRESLEN
jgi:predicted RNA-binding protein with RPS1 domain